MPQKSCSVKKKRARGYDGKRWDATNGGSILRESGRKMPLEDEKEGKFFAMASTEGAFVKSIQKNKKTLAIL